MCIWWPPRIAGEKQAAVRRQPSLPTPQLVKDPSTQAALPALTSRQPPAPTSPWSSALMVMMTYLTSTTEVKDLIVPGRGQGGGLPK